MTILQRLRLFAAGMCTCFPIYSAIVPITPAVSSRYEAHYFEPNVGQAGRAVRFVGRARNYSALVENTAIALELPGGSQPGSRHKLDLVRFDFAGGTEPGELRGVGRLPGKSNYFLGSDPAEWHTRIPHFSGVESDRILPGVSIRYHLSGGDVEYDLEVSAEAAPEQIRFTVDGSRGLRIGRDGDLIISAPNGEVRQRRPVAYQIVDGQRSSVEVSYELTAEYTVSFRVGTYRPKLPLVIDPVIGYSTYLGQASSGHAIAVDTNGGVYVIGDTTSSTFPMKNAPQGSLAGGIDVFVTKFDPTGTTLVYSTYLGSSGDDLASGIAVDSSGNAYVTGLTEGSNFPTSNALQPLYGGNGDAFVTKLSPDGSVLVYSTFLGGSGSDEGLGIAVDSNGSAYVCGSTSSTSFPIASPVSSTLGGAGDAFLTIFNPSGSALQFSTYFGGSDSEFANAVVLDGQGGAWIGGATSSVDLPVVGAFQSAYGGFQDGFVAHFSAQRTLSYSSYIGGGGQDTVLSMAMHPSGDLVLFGSSGSSDFPSVAALLPWLNAFPTCFVARMNASNGLVFSTFLSVGPTQCGGVAVDPSGNIAVVGASDDVFPLVSALGSGTAVSNQAIFVAKLEGDGSFLRYSTFLANSHLQQDGNGIAVDSSGAVYITGDAEADLPLVNAYQTSTIGSATVTKILDTDSCTYTVSPTSFSFGLAGGSGTVQVTTGPNCWWNPAPNAFSNFQWQSLAGSFNTATAQQAHPWPVARGSGTVSFTVLTGDSGPDLIGTVLVAGRKVTITQHGTGCPWSITGATSVSFTPSGGSGLLIVDSNFECTAKVQTDVNWITVFGASQVTTGGEINYQVATNPGGTRTGTISVGGAVLSVMQTGGGVGPVTLSSPANEAQGVTSAPTLAWTTSTGATSYDVYFGTVPIPPFITNTSGTTYSPATLGAGVTYYWRVIAKNTAGTASSEIWSFTTQASSAPATIVSPAAGSQLPMNSVTFTWTTTTGADQYWLDVGSRLTQGDYFGQATTSTSVQVSSLPCDGRPVYVQLWTHIGGAWQTPNRYTYTAASGCAALMALADNSTFAGNSVTFTWSSATGADQYRLDVGNLIGKSDIYGAATTALSTTVNNIPCDGRTIFVQLWTHISGVWNNPGQYRYTADTCSTQTTAQMSSPTPGSTFASTSQAFNWTSVTGATQYWLDVAQRWGRVTFTAPRPPRPPPPSPIFPAADNPSTCNCSRF
jgi:hypothetical protein